MENRKNFYKQKINFLERKIATLKKSSNLLSFLRVIAFIAAIVFLVLYFNKEFYSSLLIGLFGLFFLMFLALVKIHLRVIKKTGFLKKLLTINENEYNVLHDTPSIFNDGGKFSNAGNYSNDLDVFGPGSLYQMINRCGTHFGEENLAKRFLSPLNKKEDIKKEQAAIKELSIKVDLRQHIFASLINKSKEPVDPLVGMEHYQPVFTRNALWKTIAIAWPIFFIPFTIYALPNNLFGAWIVFLILGIAISGFKIRQTNKLHNLVSQKNNHISNYIDALKSFIKEDYQAERLKCLEKELAEAEMRFGKLKRIINYFDQRLNIIMGFVLNMFFFYDIHCSVATEKWIKNNKSKLPDWFNALGEVEMLNSMANFSFNNPGFSFPSISEKPLYFKAEELSHPLISPLKRVSNDITLGDDEKLYLITGSNMTGKTTFLRSLGVNLLLMRCGAPVCASSFEASVMELFTSIRNTDSLKENTSLFYAELNKLSSILQQMNNGRPSLVLLDEILKGTNHDDKVTGSYKIAERFKDMNCISILATHDTKLAELEQKHPGKILNFHFDSTVENGHLNFDYKIKPGVSTNRNATFLMKKLKIIDE